MTKPKKQFASRPESKSPPSSGDTKVVKRATNLSLDPRAVARGERFGARHGTSLSQLVGRFLSALPNDEEAAVPTTLAPSVRRLYGIAADAGAVRDVYREHLYKKFGAGS